MPTPENPKLAGSGIVECIPQEGLCPMACNECWHNQPANQAARGGSITPAWPVVAGGIVRVNSGHDSNIDREAVIAATEKYERTFYNTSIPDFRFPGPVVFTANPKEEGWGMFPRGHTRRTQGGDAPVALNLMFVRLRVSATNLDRVTELARAWSVRGVPVVLTFMRYYTKHVLPVVEMSVFDDLLPESAYGWRTAHENECYCPTRAFKKYALAVVRGRCAAAGRLVTMCGTLDSDFCRDCMNCVYWYHLTARRLRGE